MKKKTTSISINLLSAFVILLCILLSIIQPVNAWFSDVHNEGVRIEVFVGNLKLNLYQNSVSESNKILTNAENASGEVISKKYVELSGEIIPDEWIGLTLILANDDLGSSGMFVRYKFQLCKRGLTSDQLVTTYITTDNMGENPENNVAGFSYSDNWFTYSSGGVATIFDKGTQATLMTHFKVPYEAFSSSITNSDTVYIKLIIEAQTTKFN